jgi:hypothetical protein
MPDFDLARQTGAPRRASHGPDSDIGGQQLRNDLAADVLGGARDRNVFPRRSVYKTK